MSRMGFLRKVAALFVSYSVSGVLGLSTSGTSGTDVINANPTVTITSGVLIGTTSTVSTPVVATAAVTQYLGVPYASSPPQRFAPAEPPNKWSTPLRAQKRKPVCIQQFSPATNFDGRAEYLFNGFGSPPPEESEDCLYLDIFVPPGTKQSDGKAVLFWIFGGNFAFGGGSLHLYDGSSIAYNQDVIVITHGYRTNVFGFPGSPQLKSKEQNLGLLDQRLALRWVQENIGHFGGSAEKVTLFGESAGGFSIRTLIGLPPKPVPFRAAIMESETSTNMQLAVSVGNNSFGSSWLALATAVGCVEPAGQLSCMRQQPASKLKSVSESTGQAFFPIEDDVTYVADIRPAMAAGHAAKVPFIIGTNLNEARFVPYLLGLDTNEEQLAKLLGKFFLGNPALVSIVKELYPGHSVSDVVAQVATDAIYVCPSSQLATFAQSHGFKVWRYLFSPAFPNQMLFPGAGAYHTTEISSVFGTYFLSNSHGRATEQQIAIAKYMQTAWANFAKNPSSGPELGWPQLGYQGKVNNIGANGSHGGTTITSASFRPALCDVLDQFPAQQPL